MKRGPKKNLRAKNDEVWLELGKARGITMTALQGSWKSPRGDWKKSFDPKRLLKLLRQFFKKDGSVSITDYLDDRLIVFLKAETQQQAIEELIEALSCAHQLKDREQFHQAILDREKVVSTGIGLGVAVPHAKLPGYDQFFIAIGVKEGSGIQWDSCDHSRVHLIFMIGGPDNKQTEYLDVLSRLTTAVKDAERRKALLKATSASQVVALFRGC